MNTTHRALPKPIDLPQFPAEIWLSILERACVAGIWNPFTVENAIEFSISEARRRNKIYKQSLVTKRYVVRVCKQWNAWAVPYLYEHIYLGRSKCLRPLRNALMKSNQPEPAISTSHGLGWWTKQLDIALRDEPPSLFLFEEEENSLVSDILECLPNLTIVNFDTHGAHGCSFPTTILSSLTNSSGSNLQAVSWHNDCSPQEAHAWQALIDKAANIRRLLCPNGEMTCRAPYPLLPSLQCIRLKTKTLDGELPSLRHLISNVYLDYDGWRGLLALHGGKLEIIQLYLDQEDDILLSPLLACFSRFCTKLVRLDLSISEWGILDLWGRHELIPPTGVRVLGLQNTAIQASAKGYRSLFTGLKKLQLTPSLRCIQLTDCGNVNDLSQKHTRMMMNLVAMLKERGLELRDHEGSLMS
ncbi:hypothetical protein C0991_006715 [Blastosporella zonata]|nr:hypothetical protein C0991_006715 [Blastosporella zonata]